MLQVVETCYSLLGLKKCFSAGSEHNTVQHITHIKQLHKDDKEDMSSALRRILGKTRLGGKDRKHLT